MGNQLCIFEWSSNITFFLPSDVCSYSNRNGRSLSYIFVLISLQMKKSSHRISKCAAKLFTDANCLSLSGVEKSIHRTKHIFVRWCLLTAIFPKIPALSQLIDYFRCQALLYYRCVVLVCSDSCLEVRFPSKQGQTNSTV